jgi:chemotaxis protein MotB
VVRALQEKGVDPTKLAAAGYGEFQPIAGNDTPEGKSLNRRIEIVLATAQ